MNLDFENKDTPMYKAKMRSEDRILVVEPAAGKKPVSTYGTMDPRIFKGGNKLHCIRGPHDNLWRFKFDNGIVPEPLKAKWTTFQRAYEFATEYFAKRNLEIKEVVDDYTSSYA